MLGAVSFPRFLTDLISGVFRAILASNAEEIQRLGCLSARVAAAQRSWPQDLCNIQASSKCDTARNPGMCDYDHLSRDELVRLLQDHDRLEGVLQATDVMLVLLAPAFDFV